MSGIVRVGLVSDTHGSIPPEALAALEGVTRILHAGDIGSRDVLVVLREIAPVTAVRGNTDDARMSVPGGLQPYTIADIGGVRFAVTHILGRALTLEQARSQGCDVYVYGHTHRPDVHREDGIVVVNPGSPSYARGGSGHSVAVVEVSAGSVLDVEILSLA